MTSERKPSGIWIQQDDTATLTVWRHNVIDAVPSNKFVRNDSIESSSFTCSLYSVVYITNTHEWQCDYCEDE